MAIRTVEEIRIGRILVKLNCGHWLYGLTEHDHVALGEQFFCAQGDCCELPGDCREEELPRGGPGW